MPLYRYEKAPSRGEKIAQIIAQGLRGYLQGKQLKEQRAMQERQMGLEEALAKWRTTFPSGFTEAQLESFGLTPDEISQRNRRRENLRRAQEGDYYGDIGGDELPIDIEGGLSVPPETPGTGEAAPQSGGPIARPPLPHPPLAGGSPGWWPSWKLAGKAAIASPKAVLGEGAKDLANVRNIRSKVGGWLGGQPEKTARPGDSVIDGVVISSNARPIKVAELQGDAEGNPVMETDNRGEYILTDSGVRIYKSHLVATDNKVYVYMGNNLFVEVKQEGTKWVKVE